MKKTEYKCLLCELPATGKHHIYPVTHFGKRSNRFTVPLCDKHHRRSDDALLSIEAFFGRVPWGTRYRLNRRTYTQIARNLRLI